VAARYGLGFIPLQEEQYDFIVPTSRLERPAVRAFRALLDDTHVRAELAALGFRVAHEERAGK
jgi:putative molybdopterin biosynthesis protein